MTPQFLAPDDNLLLTSTGSGVFQVIIEGDASTSTVLEVSPDGGTTWRETMPSGVTDLTNIGAFVLECAAGFSYRFTSGAGGEGVNVYLAPR